MPGALGSVRAAGARAAVLPAMANTTRVSKAPKATATRAAEPTASASALQELHAEEALADIAGGDDGFGDFGGFDWGYDSFGTGLDPFATDPFATDPFATDPFVTDPFATDPFATDPFATDPWPTATTDPGAMGPFVTDPGTAATTDPSVEELIDGMSTPRGEFGEAPPIDVTGVTVTELTPQQQFDQTVDLLQNYRDTASPGELTQLHVGNCAVISVVNALNSTPEGQAYINSLVTDLGDDRYNVRLTGTDGQPQNVPVTFVNNAYAQGDKTLQIVNAAVIETNGMIESAREGMGTGEGVWPSEVMTQLGLQNVQMVDGGAVALQAATGGNFVAVIDYATSPTSTHANPVLGVVTNPDTGAPNMVTANTWSTNSTGSEMNLPPISAAAADSLNHSFIGQIPAPPPPDLP